MEFSKVTEGRRTKSFKAIISRMEKYKHRSERLIIGHSDKWLNKPWKENEFDRCCFANAIFGFCLDKQIKDYPSIPVNELLAVPPLGKVYELSRKGNEEKRPIADEDFHRLEWAFTQKETAIKIFDCKYNTFYLRHLLVIMGIYDCTITYRAPKGNNTNMILESPIGWGLIAKIREK